ncbi:MAG: efflux RND transporter periplasmic adaptor subunit [Fibrobacterales bacterium]
MKTHNVKKALLAARVGLFCILVGIVAGCNAEKEPAKGEGVGEGAIKNTPQEAHAGHDDHADHAKHGEDQCTAHGADKSECWICDPTLRDKNRLWCKGHDTYEDRCWKCHPDLKDDKRLYCGEHGVYEDECTLCHPELKKKEHSDDHSELESQKSTVAQTENVGLYCTEHALPELECAICHPELLNDLVPGTGLKVRFPTVESAKKAGVTWGPAKRAQRTTMGNNGFLSRLSYNQNQMAHVGAKVKGTMGRVLVNNGSVVKKGQVLGYLSSPDAAKAKSAYLTAVADSTLKSVVYSREKGLVREKISSQRELDNAHAKYQQALAQLGATVQVLVDLGLSSGEIQRLRTSGKASSSVVLRAPFKGTVVQRNAVSGAVAQPDNTLFTIVDLSTMWIEMSIPAVTALQLSSGDAVVAQFAELGADRIEGVITWIASEINEANRMVTVRAELSNPNERLKKGLYGRAFLAAQPQVANGEPLMQLEVPQQALQRIEGKQYLFVSHEQDLFEARHIQVGALDGNTAIIVAGLSEGEKVVHQGSFTVRSEMFKSSFGAGCTH